MACAHSLRDVDVGTRAATERWFSSTMRRALGRSPSLERWHPTHRNRPKRHIRGGRRAGRNMNGGL